MVYIEGSQFIIKKILYFFEDRTVQMLNHVAFYLGLHCLSKYSFGGGGSGLQRV